MIDSTKLLIVLSDVAYVAELLAGKKPYTFSLQACKQINGTFMTKKGPDNEAVAKLFQKLDAGESYHLVLPDELFVDTIVSIEEKAESKVKEVLKEKTLADLKISDESHYLETITLNQLKGTTRVQIAAIPKEYLSIFRVGSDESGSTISGISPLSWVVKGMVSLEPSISVIQLGESLYVAQHYIGIDQTSSADISAPDKIVETIKTLKGSEPSIQTVYLLTNTVIEEQLKEALSSLVPLQQMTGKSDSEQLPSYVTTFLESAARSLAVPDFNIPVFKPGAPAKDESEKLAALFTAASTATDVSTDTKTETEPTTKEDELPKPTQNIEPEEITQADTEEAEDTEDKLADDAAQAQIEEVVEKDTTDSSDTEADVQKEVESDSTTKDEQSIEQPEEKQTAATGEEATDKADTDSSSESKIDSPDSNRTITPVASVVTPVAASATNAATVATTTSTAPKTAKPETALDQTGGDDIDLSQFAQHTAGTTAQASSTPAQAEKTIKKPIKHSSGVGNMLKMVLITLLVFALTIAVGVGVGLGILQFAGTEEEVTTPTVEVEQEPSETEEEIIDEEATDSAEEADTEVEAVDLSELSVLVVNATSTAGYAGQIRTQLLAGEFTDVTAGNASGTYDDGVLVFAREGAAAVIAEIERTTDLEVTESSDAAAEDAQNNYDVVIVLAE